MGVRELDKGLASFRARELRRAAREILLTEKRIKRSEDKTRAKVKPPTSPSIPAASSDAFFPPPREECSTVPFRINLRDWDENENNYVVRYGGVSTEGQVSTLDKVSKRHTGEIGYRGSTQRTVPRCSLSEGHLSFSLYSQLISSGLALPPFSLPLLSFPDVSSPIDASAK